jgi:hypothetical protein
LNGERLFYWLEKVGSYIPRKAEEVIKVNTEYKYWPVGAKI